MNPGDTVYIACTVGLPPDKTGWLALDFRSSKTGKIHSEVVHKDDPRLARHRDDILASAELASRIRRHG